MADGRILIDTKIDTKGAKESLESLEYQIRKSAEYINELRKKMDALADQEIPTQEYEELQNKLSEAEKSLSSLVAQQEEWESLGVVSGDAWDTLNENIAKASDNVDSIKEKMQELVDSGKAFTLGSETAEYASYERQIEYEERAIEEAAKHYNAIIRNEKILERLKSAALSALEGIKNAFSKTIGQLGRSSKATSSIGTSLKTILKYSLGIRSLYALVGKLRAALVEGFKNLAQYSDNTNATLSGLMSSLAQCKNALATAFDPILQAVAPALNYLINLVTAAATAVAQLIAILTGKGTFIKATKVQKDYAKALKGTGGAAKEAEGALASFDKLNVMPDQNAGGGGGGGAGAGIEDMFETVKVGDSFKKLSDLFKSKDWKGIGKYVADQLNEGLRKIYDVINWDNIGPRITYFVNAFTETFNSLVDNLDWDLLGRTLGAGVNTITYTLNTLFDGIDWVGLGRKLGEGANGLVDEIDWYALGRLLLQKLNATMETLYGFVTEFDWTKFGKSLGEGINGAISSIDPKMWAGALSGLVKGLLDTINGLLLETDWQQIGNKIAIFIGEIDYSGIFTSLSYGIGAALASLAEFIWGLVEKAWDNVVKWWKENAFEDGKFTMQGLLDGILEGLKNIGSWIMDHIVTPFLDGFRDAFGIHSPSTVMKEMGGYLMEGLKEGIEGMIPNIIEAVTGLVNQIGELIDGALESIKRLDDAGGFGTGVAGKLVSGWKGRAAATPSAQPVRLPRLASGTVVPPRAGEFAAILGDNRREAEVVSPLSTMEKAMGNVLQKYGSMGGGDINLTVNLDGRVVYQNVVKRNRMEKDRTGLNPLIV